MFSIAILVLMIPLAVVGVIGVTVAVVVHEAAELLAVINGLRAGRIESVQPARVKRDATVLERTSLNGYRP